MTTNFLFAQSPNRKGNVSKHTPNSNTGVTAVTGPKHGTAHPKGNQGAPSYSRQTDNTQAGATGGRHQKVMVDNKGCAGPAPNNYGYMDKSTKNYLG